MNTLPFQFLLVTLAGWVNRGQQDVIGYLQEENRVLREHLGSRRLHFTDAQRSRLANKAKAIGRQTLSGIGPVVTPDTLLRWYRTLIARKYDGSRAAADGADAGGYRAADRADGFQQPSLGLYPDPRRAAQSRT
jgi:hypothetical protein